MTSGPPKSPGAAVRKNAFVHKLYGMLCNPDLQNLIWWSGTPHGHTFSLYPSKDFANALHGYFKHGNVASFVRQLHMYGFHKVNDSQASHSASGLSPVWEFKHSSGNFKKNDESSLVYIKRRSQPGAQRSSVSSAHQSPAPVSVSDSEPSQQMTADGAPQLHHMAGGAPPSARGSLAVPPLEPVPHGHAEYPASHNALVPVPQHYVPYAYYPPAPPPMSAPAFLPPLQFPPITTYHAPQTANGAHSPHHAPHAYEYPPIPMRGPVARPASASNPSNYAFAALPHGTRSYSSPENGPPLEHRVQNPPHNGALNGNFGGHGSHAAQGTTLSPRTGGATSPAIPSHENVKENGAEEIKFGSALTFRKPFDASFPERQRNPSVLCDPLTTKAGPLPEPDFPGLRSRTPSGLATYKPRFSFSKDSLTKLDEGPEKPLVAAKPASEDQVLTPKVSSSTSESVSYTRGKSILDKLRPSLVDIESPNGSVFSKDRRGGSMGSHSSSIFSNKSSISSISSARNQSYGSISSVPGVKAGPLGEPPSPRMALTSPKSTSTNAGAPGESDSPNLGSRASVRADKSTPWSLPKLEFLLAAAEVPRKKPKLHSGDD